MTDTATTTEKRKPGRPKKQVEVVDETTPKSPVDEAIGRLLDELRIDPRDLLALEVIHTGTIRLRLGDNSARTVRFAALPRYQRDREGRIVK